MRTSNQADVIAQQFHGLSIPQSHYGIVSPCSTCMNQRSIPSSDGKPACPRRAAAIAKQELDDNGFDSSNLGLVVLTGNSPGDQDDGTKSLTNPVYDPSSNSILVWSATFKDNGPTYASDGTLVSPDILDPNFSSDWLQCWVQPFSPREGAAQYFQKGCLMEGDQVEIVVSNTQQINKQSDGTLIPMPIAGSVQKVNATGQFPLSPLTKDLVPSGC
jgi:hypothetical protein